MPLLSDAELQHIVLHECEHLRRHDDWLNLLQKFALAILPLNPALLWVDGRLGLERELACDAGVVAATGGALDYASCLTRLAEYRLGRGRVALALSAWARRSELARRVYTLLQPVRRISRVGSRGVLAAALCALLAVAEGVVHTPALISFTSAGGDAVVAVSTVHSDSARALPVAFHFAGPQPRAVLASAQVSAAPQPARLRRMPSHRASRPRLEAAAPRIFETVAPVVKAPVYAVPVRFSYSYAAVPFGDGWLIVQL